MLSLTFGFDFAFYRSMMTKSAHLLPKLVLASVLWPTLAVSADNFCLGDKPVDGLSSGLGFYSRDNTACMPASIKHASDRIFEQRVLSASGREFLRSVDLTTPEGAALKEKIEAIEPTLGFDEKDKLILLKQLERCEMHESLEVKKNCMITLEIRKSTGFFAGDSQSLWTNAHAIEGFVDAVKLLDGESIEDMKNHKYPVRIFLFDSNGQLVLNPYENEITIERLPEKSLVARVRNSFYAEDSDFVRLKVSKPFTSPIPLAKIAPRTTDQVFLAGYSGCTGCEPPSEGVDPNDYHSRGDGWDSDGYGIKYSRGYILDGTRLWTSFFGLSEQSAGRWQLDKMLFYSADSQVGNSGGPILNANGEVVGIHAGGLTKLANGTIQRVSRGILFPQ